MERDKIKGEFPYYGASGIVDHINAYIFSHETILLSEDGENLNTRKTPVAFRARGKYWVNNHAHVLLPKKEHYFPIITNFLNAMDLSEYITGAVQPKLSQANLAKISILLPDDEEEQIRLANLLSSLDDKIDLLHRQNKTLESLASTLWRKMFVEEAGADWKAGTIGQIAENVRDNVLAEKLTEESNYVGLEHIARKDCVLCDWGNASNVASNKSKFKKNDVLFGKLRVYFHKVCFAPIEGVCSTDILVVRAKDPCYFPFLLYLLFSNEVVDYADSSSSGTHMPRTNWDTVSSYEVMMPSNDSLNAYNDKVFPFIKKMDNNVQLIQKLISLRNILLPKLISGDIAGF